MQYGIYNTVGACQQFDFLNVNLKSEIYWNFECSTSEQSGNKDVNTYTYYACVLLCMSIPIRNGQTKTDNFNEFLYSLAVTKGDI